LPSFAHRQWQFGSRAKERESGRILSPAFFRAFVRGGGGSRRSTVARPLCILRPLARVQQFTTSFDIIPHDSTVGRLRQDSTSFDSRQRPRLARGSVPRPKTLVVEHKVGMRRLGFWSVFSLLQLQLMWDALRSLRIPSGMHLRFCDYLRPKPPPLISLHVKGVSTWPSEQSESEAPVGWTRQWPEGRSALQPTMSCAGHVCEEHRCRTVSSPWAIRRP
jgi:hypothetical protein